MKLGSAVIPVLRKWNRRTRQSKPSAVTLGTLSLEVNQRHLRPCLYEKENLRHSKSIHSSNEWGVGPVYLTHIWTEFNCIFLVLCLTNSPFCPAGLLEEAGFEDLLLGSFTGAFHSGQYTGSLLSSQPYVTSLYSLAVPRGPKVRVSDCSAELSFTQI